MLPASTGSTVLVAGAIMTIIIPIFTGIITIRITMEPVSIGTGDMAGIILVGAMAGRSHGVGIPSGDIATTDGIRSGAIPTMGATTGAGMDMDIITTIITITTILMAVGTTVSMDLA